MKRSTKAKMQEAGITLVALVVTIIVLLILAGITISLVLNNNGIIQRAKDASGTWANASTNEEAMMGTLYNDISTHTEGYVNLPGGGNPGETAIDYSSLTTGAPINYTAPSGTKDENGGDITWKVLYGTADGDLYIMADQRCKNKDNTLNFGTIDAVFTNRNGDAYSGTTLINTIPVQNGLISRLENLLSKKTLSKEKTSLQATNYMLDTENWSQFVNQNKGASWAIGGPTAEMAVIAYNKNIISNFEQSPELPDEAWMYQVGIIEEDGGEYGVIDTITYSLECQVPNSWNQRSGFDFLGCDGASEYWIAAPQDVFGGGECSNLLRMINWSPSFNYNNIITYNAGFRPVVHLTGVEIEGNASTGYIIR